MGIDYHSLLGPGELPEINTIIEIGLGSTLKIEYNTKFQLFELDRVEPGIFAKPTNYGFIPGTLDEDGDALDTLVVTREPLPTGLYLKARVLGVLNFVDDGENDHKIICVPADDRDRGDDLQSLDDLGASWKKQVEHHFNHYKDLKKGGTEVQGYGSPEDAAAVIADCIKRYQAGN